MSWIQDLKVLLSDYLHLAKDALHIYVALGVFFGACLLFRWKASDWKPWLCVLLAALTGEVIDLSQNYAIHGAVPLLGSIKDIVNTLTVPTMIMLLARHNRMFDQSAKS